MNAPTGIRLPPHSIEAEQSVLGALLLDPRAWERIADIVTADDFYRDDHRRIFRHIAVLAHAGKAADVVTVFEAMDRSHEAELIGGLPYLGEIANAVPSAANIKRYAEIVAERARYRKLAAVADEIAALAMGTSQPVESLLDAAQARIADLAEERAASGDPIVAGDYLSGVVDRIEREHLSDASAASQPYGFADLDHQTGGMMPGDMIVIAGRPSMGKTAFALDIGNRIAVGKREAVLVFSLEMTGDQLVTRALSSFGSISADRLRTPKRMQDGDWNSMTDALGHLSDAPLYIDETAGLTIERIRAKARRLWRKVGRLGLIVIDYLQLIESARQGNTRNDEITQISRGIKALAKELACPVIALSQLSRKVEERPNKRPLMSDLRESGAIEQDADQILLLYREDYYHPETAEKGVVEVNVAKHRNGETGKVDLIFQREFSRFRDIDHAWLAAARSQEKPMPKSRRRAGEDD